MTSTSRPLAKRVNITLPPDVLETLESLCEVHASKRSTYIAKLIKDAAMYASPNSPAYSPSRDGCPNCGDPACLGMVSSNAEDDIVWMCDAKGGLS